MFVPGGQDVHPSVVEAAVVGVPDPERGEVGRAFVRYADGGGPSREELREFLRARLAGHEVPAHIEVVERSPRTGVGKVRKAELRRFPAS